MKGAPTLIAEERRDDAFFDEDFGSRVLTIPVGIDPELPLVPVLRREVGEHRCDRERWRCGRSCWRADRRSG
jgi:hypothetical protein